MSSSSSSSQTHEAYVSRQLERIRLLALAGQSSPETAARSLLDMFEQCEAMHTPQEIMSALIEAVGKLAVLSRDVDIVKELFIKLYTPRFATHFSDAALCQVLQQIQVFNEPSQYLNLQLIFVGISRNGVWITSLPL